MSNTNIDVLESFIKKEYLKIKKGFPKLLDSEEKLSSFRYHLLHNLHGFFSVVAVHLSFVLGGIIKIIDKNSLVVAYSNKIVNKRVFHITTVPCNDRKFLDIECLCVTLDKRGKLIVSKHYPLKCNHTEYKDLSYYYN